jgi:hypothetical protein
MLTGLKSISMLLENYGIYGAANYHDGGCSICVITSSNVGTYGSEFTNSFATSVTSE